MNHIEDEIYYINSACAEACLYVTQHLIKLLSCCAHTNKAGLAFVCIGSDRVTGDSLGPFIGSQLRKNLSRQFSVYGTLTSPIHALNLQQILPVLKERHKDHILVAIDASLGTTEHQGYITMGKGCLSPGAGVNKILESVGDVFITGIVGTSGPLSHLTLQTARLSSVMAVADPIVDGILNACDYLSKEALIAAPY